MKFWNVTHAEIIVILKFSFSGSSTEDVDNTENELFENTQQGSL